MDPIFMDIYNSHGVASAKATAEQVKDKVGMLQDDVKVLQKNVDHLLVINQALWELVKEKTGLTDIELQSKMLEVETAHGGGESKITVAVRKCPKCSKTMHPKHTKCLYCGHVDETSSSMSGAHQSVFGPV